MSFIIRPISKHDSKMIQQIGEMLTFLQRGYPDFRKWYLKTVTRELGSSCRQIYVATHDNDIAGVLILKNTAIEKKVCTLFIAESYRSQHLGTELLHHALKVLGTEKPVITVSDMHKAEFSGLFQKFGFTPYDEYSEYYLPGVTECAYNGPIEPIALKGVVGV